MPEVPAWAPTGRAQRRDAARYTVIMRSVPLLVMFGVATLFLGCGQKGPLVLPDAQHPQRKIFKPKPASSPAPLAPSPPAVPSTPLGSVPPPGDAGGTDGAGAAPAPQR